MAQAKGKLPEYLSKPRRGERKHRFLTNREPKDLPRSYQIHRIAPAPAIRIYPCRSQNQITLLEDWHGLRAFWTDKILDGVDGHGGGAGGVERGAASARAVERRNQ
jgi:hypothetical protein